MRGWQPFIRWNYSWFIMASQTSITKFYSISSLFKSSLEHRIVNTKLLVILLYNYISLPESSADVPIVYSNMKYWNTEILVPKKM